MSNWTGIWFVSLVILLLASNVFFRLKLLRIYKKLRRANAKVTIASLHNGRERQKVKSRYPAFASDIEEFARTIRLSSIVSIILVVALALSALFFKVI
jgi:hypothetical protein